VLHETRTLFNLCIQRAPSDPAIAGNAHQRRKNCMQHAPSKEEEKKKKKKEEEEHLHTSRFAARFDITITCITYYNEVVLRVWFGFKGATSRFFASTRAFELLQTGGR
jgi:hypothetical protein